MKRRIQKGLAVSSVFLLGMTTTLPSINMVLAETVPETELSVDEKPALPYDDLLETPTTDFSTTEEQAVVEEPMFSFQQEKMTGTVGEAANVVILVDRPSNQVQVSIPKELTVVFEELPEEMEATQESDEEWKFTAEESQEFRIPISADTAGEFTLQLEDEINGTIIFGESENQKSKNDLENGMLSENSDDDQSVGEENTALEETQEGVVSVVNWVEFVRAFSDRTISTIEIIDDFEVPTTPLNDLTGILTGSNSNVSGAETFVYLNSSQVSRKLTVNGNGHQIDFGSVSFGMTSATHNANSPWDVTFSDLDIYSGNWWGFFQTYNLTLAQHDLSNITLNNINSYGNQVMAPYYTNVDITGVVNNPITETYTSKFRTNWRVNTPNITNFEVGSLTVKENAELNLSSPNAGNLVIGVGSRSANLVLEENSTMNLNSNGTIASASPNSTGASIDILNGDLIMKKGSTINIDTTRSFSAITLRSANSKIKLEDEAKVNVNSTGHTWAADGVGRNLVYMAAGGSLVVDNGSEFNVLATNRGTAASDIVYVAGRGTVDILKNGSLNIQSDSSSISQRLIFFSATNSTVSFSDARKVNLQRTATISGGNSNGLINIAGSTGRLAFDVQSVQQWTRDNQTDTPDHAWEPLFNLAVSYTGFTPRITSVSSISQEIADNFSENFTTQNVQRVLFEKIPDVEVTIDPLTGDPAQINSYRITGKATPDSLIRFSGDSAIPVGTIDSPDPSDSTSFHVQADENGDYQFDLPTGRRFTSSNEVTAYAFLNGKTDTASTIVEEYTPTGPSNPVDPLEPEVEVDPENKPELPENQGLLSIDFVSQFNFDTQSISATDKTYYAQPQRLLNEEGEIFEDEKRPNYVQISDRRTEGERIGWELSVMQSKQFSTSTGTELVGAQLRFMNQQLATAQTGTEPTVHFPEEVILVPEEKQILLSADESTGTGTWIYRFGNEENLDSSVALDVPKYSTPESTVYQTKLIWELSSVPENTLP